MVTAHRWKQNLHPTERKQRADGPSYHTEKMARTQGQGSGLLESAHERVSRRSELPVFPRQQSRFPTACPTLSINTFLVSAMWLRFLFGKHGSHHSLAGPPSDVPRGLTDGRSPGAELGKHTLGSLLGVFDALLLFVGVVYSQLAISEGNCLVGPMSQKG